MNNNKKTLYESFVTGLKHGWNTPMLPPKVISFNNHPIIRIFRVIGGMSVLTVLLKKHLLLWPRLNYLVLFIALIHILYFGIVSVIKILFGIHKLWKGDLNVRNSPLDRFASLTGNLLYCLKVGCTVASSGISIAGASVIADTVLEAGGQEKVFTPLLGKGVKLCFKGRAVDNIYTEIYNDISKIKETKDKFNELVKLSEQSELSDDKIFSKEDQKSIKSFLEEAKNMENSKLQSYAKDLAKKIKDSSDNKK